MRPTCQRCLRPEGFCLCLEGRPIASRTRVVILQHPREARLAICSAWMTRLALENAELHRGVRFADSPRVRELCASPGSALLFPGAGSAPASAHACDPPPVLIAIDATWHQAERMLEWNPFLSGLPRIGVWSDRPSGYGELRREPGPGTLPTIEAVALALGELERDRARFEPMREAFRRAVEAQLSAARGPRRSPRHRRRAAGLPLAAAPLSRPEADVGALASAPRRPTQGGLP